MEITEETLQCFGEILPNHRIWGRDSPLEVAEIAVRVMGKNLVYFNATLSVCGKAKERPVRIIVVSAGHQNPLDDEAPDDFVNESVFPTLQVRSSIDGETAVLLRRTVHLRLQISDRNFEVGDLIP